MQCERIDEGDVRIRRAVVLTLPLAFALHDLEELLVVPRWSEHAADHVAPRHPLIGEALTHVFPISRAQMATAVGVVTAAIAGVTAASLRDTDGDLRPLQAALAGFAGHSAAHVGASVAFRGYTPGLATVPLVVVRYSLWAWSRLRRAGVAATRDEAVRAVRNGLASALSLALIGHGLARVWCRRRLLRPRTTNDH